MDYVIIGFIVVIALFLSIGIGVYISNSEKRKRKKLYQDRDNFLQDEKMSENDDLIEPTGNSDENKSSDSVDDTDWDNLEDIFPEDHSEEKNEEDSDFDLDSEMDKEYPPTEEDFPDLDEEMADFDSVDEPFPEINEEADENRDHDLLLDDLESDLYLEEPLTETWDEEDFNTKRSDIVLSGEEVCKKIIAGEEIPSGITIDGNLEFPDDDMFENIVIENAVINGDVNLEGITIRKNVNFKRSTIKGTVNLDGASAEIFDFRKVVVKNDFHAECDFTQELNLSHSIINGDFAASGKHIFKGDVICEKMKLKGSFLSEDVIYSKTLILSNAIINGKLLLDGAEIKSLEAQKIHVREECNLNNAEFNGDATFAGGHFYNDIYFSNATFEGNADFSEIILRGDFGEETNASEENCEFKKNLDLTFSRLGSNLNLAGVFIQNLNISHSIIKNDCQFQNSEIENFSYDSGVIHGDINLDEAEINVFPGLTVKGDINL
jgi:hypothetical protein